MKGQKTRKNSFVLYHSYAKHLKRLSDEQVGKLMRCVFHYSETGEVLELEPLLEVAFNFIKEDIDINKEKWERRAEINREVGKKGGRPKKSPTKPKEPNGFNKNPKEPKKPVSVSVNGSVSDNEKSKEEKTPEYGDKELNKIQEWLRVNYPKTLTDLQDRKNLNSFRTVLTARKDKDEWMHEEALDNLKIFYSDYDRFRPDQFKIASVYKLRELVKEWRECGGKFKDEGQQEARRVAYMRQQQTEHEQRKREDEEYYKHNQGYGSKLANKFSIK